MRRARDHGQRRQGLTPKSIDVKLASQEAEDAAKETNQGLGFVRISLLGFGGIAPVRRRVRDPNTLSITVARRTREFAIRRTLVGDLPQLGVGPACSR